MQPYQEASEAIKAQSDQPGNIIRNALSATAALAGGGAIIKKIVPFLNDYIPADMAVKGLSKVSPFLSKFVNGAQNNGYSSDQIIDFMRNKVEDKPESQNESPQNQPAQEDRNIIQQYDPELHEYISQNIKKGMSPVQAGQKALSHERFQKAIKQIEKDHKTKISQILQSIYGSQDMGQSANIPQAEQEQAIQPQQNAGTQALMDALNRAREARQRRAGGG